MVQGGGASLGLPSGNRTALMQYQGVAWWSRIDDVSIY